jgi:hypothetical protein
MQNKYGASSYSSNTLFSARQRNNTSANT